jgi:toxin ParE1/3/4
VRDEADSEAYGKALAERVVRHAELLERSPYLGAAMPEYADIVLREIYEHPFRILYRVLGDRVQIVTLIHHARLLPRNPLT